MAWGFQLSAELPHDVMNEGQLPACTLARELTLLLGGFDRCAVGSDASRLRIAKLPAASDWQAIYDDSSISPKNLTAMAAEFPQARLENQRKQVTLTGSTAAHLRLLRPVVSERSASRPSPRNNGGEKDPLQTQNYTIMLKQPQPIRSVLAAFVKQSGLGLEVRWDKSLSELQMQAQVTLDVKNAKLDQVLETLATQSQLTIVRTGKAIDVRPIVKEGAGK